ncbi:CPBP family intramembrane glutamic endopeptidase [Aestuariivivens insulae]|uniref:CPBP family intramembrane glutamic endopeptidase n=1 Tax=Aestuariivivens insulae TaxID=1621988 RepID=UPI001F5606A8|nr:CPBP family intramembrane glutamic endopeptidase [Aestuariivivens insulae]
MDSLRYKIIEFFIIFMVLPIGFTFNYSAWLKLSIGICGFIYICYILLRHEKIAFKVAIGLNWILFWKQTLVKLIIISALTTFFVWITNKDVLFYVLLEKPKFWFLILFIYSVFSVYPQEIVYRTFFFNRYKTILTNKNVLIVVNALVFSLGHVFFKNLLVLILTFLGGLLFALTYYKTRSTLLVSIEHAIYGSWLFTVGMGSMLGFPD